MKKHNHFSLAKTLPGLLPWLWALLALASCGRRQVLCYTFQATPQEGWEQHNALAFPMDSVEQAGLYELSVGVRTTYAYPYQSLWLQVTTRMDSATCPRVDTLVLRVTDGQGHLQGQGMSLFQLLQPLRREHLQAGQRGVVEVRHLMRTALLPGVSDVGVRLRRVDR